MGVSIQALMTVESVKEGGGDDGRNREDVDRSEVVS